MRIGTVARASKWQKVSQSVQIVWWFLKFFISFKLRAFLKFQEIVLKNILVQSLDFWVDDFRGQLEVIFFFFENYAVDGVGKRTA